MKLFSECSGPCETCKTFYTGGCLAGHGDNEYVHASQEWIMNRETEELRIQKLDLEKQVASFKIKCLDYETLIKRKDARIRQLEAVSTESPSELLVEVAGFMKQYADAIRGSHGGWWQAYCSQFELKVVDWDARLQKVVLEDEEPKLHTYDELDFPDD